MKYPNLSDLVPHRAPKPNSFRLPYIFLFSFWFQDVTISGDYPYVAGYESGLQIIDIRNPENPNWIGEYHTEGEAQGVAISNDYAYIADSDSGLQIATISNPGNPNRVGFYNTPGLAYKVALSEDGLIYVADIQTWESTVSQIQMQ